jgi:hypothetical protein
MSPGRTGTEREKDRQRLLRHVDLRMQKALFFIAMQGWTMLLYGAHVLFNRVRWGLQSHTRYLQKPFRPSQTICYTLLSVHYKIEMSSVELGICIPHITCACFNQPYDFSKHRRQFIHVRSNTQLCPIVHNSTVDAHILEKIIYI